MRATASSPPVATAASSLVELEDLERRSQLLQDGGAHSHGRSATRSPGAAAVRGRPPPAGGARPRSILVLDDEDQQQDDDDDERPDPDVHVSVGTPAGATALIRTQRRRLAKR